MDNQTAAIAIAYYQWRAHFKNEAGWNIVRVDPHLATPDRVWVTLTMEDVDACQREVDLIATFLDDTITCMTRVENNFAVVIIHYDGGRIYTQL